MTLRRQLILGAILQLEVTLPGIYIFNWGESAIWLGMIPGLAWGYLCYYLEMRSIKRKGKYHVQPNHSHHSQ